MSYNRPFDTRAHDATSFLFNAEYPMVRWLEANGYDVKYITGVDTERRAGDLVGASTKPKAFLSVGHDEYWSAGQRASVEAARNAGVNLAFFSGNEIYWKTRFEPSVDGTNTPYRTLVGYKDTLGGVKLDPMPGVTTGTWRDTRFGPPVADGGRPENGLIGQIWTVNSGTSAISVPASMASLRFWRNTTRRGAHRRRRPTLGTDTLGYEWGEDLDNGARPAGVIHLSSTTVQRRGEDPRLRRDGGHRHGDAQPDALQTRQRRARLRRRHRAVGVGAGRQSRPRLRSTKPGDAAGDHEPAGRHGGAARVGADPA